MNNIFAKPTGKSLPDYVIQADLTRLSRWHKNKESLPAAGREENMNTPTQECMGEVRSISSKKENQETFNI